MVKQVFNTYPMTNAINSVKSVMGDPKKSTKGDLGDQCFMKKGLKGDQNGDFLTLYYIYVQICTHL